MTVLTPVPLPHRLSRAAARAIARAAARAVARAVAPSLALSVVVAALLWQAPASAKVPEGWSDPPDVDTLAALLLLVGAPVGLFLLITLAVLVPSLARGEGLGRPEESQWLGGSSKHPRELPASTSGPSDTGGASGRW